MTAYRVTSAYVMLPVEDRDGVEVVLGFYKGAVVTPVSGDILDRHVRKGMVEKVSASAAPKADDEGGKAPAKSSK